ncbi:MAG: 4-hydroxy-tetrahydrodipicolinate synthase [Oscillospiraceae bacterium]|nr:4-hydroxy-tetrahydrodipicolinate synthase [Oscillospiraceae bacterium]
MSKNTIFTGSGCAIITPFTNTGIDFDTLDKLVDFQLENGTDAIIAAGTTGEASTMDDREHLSVIERVVKKVDGRVPVIAGTGSNDSRHGAALSRSAEQLGADALLHVTPYYNKATQDGLIKHFTLMADSVNIPVILYNVPSRTGCSIAPATLDKLADHPNVVAIKEASGNISLTAKMMSMCIDRIDFYSGNDDMNVPICSLGGKGAISVLANVAPRETHEMMAKCLEGDYAAASKMQLEAIELIDALFCEVNPIPVKTAMRLMGYEAGPLRLPLSEMSEANLEVLKTAMKNYGLLK